MSEDAKHCGIILLAHGSRDPLWSRPIEAVAQRMQLISPQTPVVCAYLEHSVPDLHAATHSLLQATLDTVRIVPMFLGVGKHVREDLPVLVAQLQSSHPQVRFMLQPPVSDDDRFLNAMCSIALESPWMSP